MLIIAVILIAIVVLVAVAALQPGTFAVERSIGVQASSDRVFSLINDFHQWTGWSPWELLDPNLNRTYGPAPAGVGAVYEWSGNKKVGAGRMEITESHAPAGLTIKLDFIRPFEGHNTTRFAVQPEGASCRVTWTMSGPKPFMMKLMGLVFSMDKMVGKDFETGLSRLKILAEG